MQYGTGYAQTYTLLKDFTGTPGWSSGDYVAQMSRSQDDDTFGFTRKNSSNWQVVGYEAWRRSTNTALLNVATTHLDEVQVDKSGRYLVIKTGQSGSGAIETQIADLQTSVVTGLADNPPDSSPGHSDNGFGTVFGADNWLNRVTGRSLAAPKSPYTVLSLPDWTQDYHISMLANGDQWATMSLLLSNSLNSTGIFRNEILMVATDGSGRVIRLAHHQSVYNGNYWNYPMANVSPDGRFIAFTSDFGSTNRRDVFILRVPYAGDANMDYLVDQADYTAWYNHYGQANATWADGDWNADRVVDQADYTLWYNNYGAGGAGVPEPASLSLLVLGGLAMIRRRKAA